MLRQDLHTHSLFDDGKDSLRDMAEGAIRKGLRSIGFSVHSPLPFENCWACREEQLPEFLSEAMLLREEMKDRLRIYIGVEFDGESCLDLSRFDYVIGSLHHIRCGDVLRAVDESAETNREIAAYFGSADRAAEAYFAQYDAIAENPGVDIVGHFDLLTKFNEQDPLFDPASPCCLAAAESAMRKLAEAGKIFELNTGAISRGYRTVPYPAEHLLKMLAAMGGKITLNSDAHSAEHLGFRFEEAAALAHRCGFRELWRFDGEKFAPLPL